MFRLAWVVLKRLKGWFSFYVLGVCFILLSVGLGSMYVSEDKYEDMYRVTKGYQVIIGARGSKNDLVLTQVFLNGVYDKTIPYSLYEKVKETYKNTEFIPLAIADSYQGSLIVGTDVGYLKNIKVKHGVLFKKSNEVVVGYDIAVKNKLQVGDKIVSSHGVGEDDHHDKELKIVGVLEKTENKLIDNYLFTDIKTIWETHSHEDVEHVEGEEHVEHTEGDLTSILVKTSSMKELNLILSDFKQDDKYMAVSTVDVVRGFYNILEDTSKALVVLMGIILFVSVLYVGSVSLFLASKLKEVYRYISVLGYSLKERILFTVYVISIVNVVVGLVSFIGVKNGSMFIVDVLEKYGIMVSNSFDIVMFFIIWGISYVLSAILWVIYALRCK